MLLCAAPYPSGYSPPASFGCSQGKEPRCMASSLEVELANDITEDPTKASPLLRLLYSFYTSRGDPLGEAMMKEVMLGVYTKVDHCEDSMVSFLNQDESSRIRPAASDSAASLFPVPASNNA